jgi:hypothetical protein
MQTNTQFIEEVDKNGASHVMKIYRIGRKINIKQKKNCHKNLLYKISATTLLILARKTLCTTRFCFLCGNKVKDGAKMLSEEATKLRKLSLCSP